MVTVEKYHGTGNDFVVVDADSTVSDRRSFAVELCDRSSGLSHPEATGTGADGVLFLSLDSDRRPPRVDMTLVQPDGSVAAMCGNGARCAAAWAARRTGSTDVSIDTPAGTHRARVGDDRVTVEMGQPRFEPELVPVEADEPVVEREIGGLTVTAVNVGVPHAVAFVDDVDAVDLVAIGPDVRWADAFPSGANVTLAAPTDAGDGFDQRTFERGVEAETHSCGTGAVAIAAVADRLGRLEAVSDHDADPPVEPVEPVEPGEGRTVRVSPPGGDLEVIVTADRTSLRGPVVREFVDQVSGVEPRSVDHRDDQ